MDSSGDFGPSARVFKKRDRLIRQSLSSRDLVVPSFLTGEFPHQRPQSKNHIATRIVAYFSRRTRPPAARDETQTESNASHFGLNFQRNSAPREIHFVVVPSRPRAPTPRARASTSRIAVTAYPHRQPHRRRHPRSSSYLSSFRAFDFCPLPQRDALKFYVSLSLSCVRARGCSPTDERGRFRKPPLAGTSPTPGGRRLARACDADGTNGNGFRRVVPLRAFV